MGKIGAFVFAKGMGQLLCHKIDGFYGLFASRFPQ